MERACTVHRESRLPSERYFVHAALLLPLRVQILDEKGFKEENFKRMRAVFEIEAEGRGAAAAAADDAAAGGGRGGRGGEKCVEVYVYVQVLVPQLVECQAFK